jgi:uncharacterized RDD family membrane protein YckC
MSTGQPDRSLGSGVYFAPADYIGFGPRLVILAVDSVVLLVTLMLLTAIWFIGFGGGDAMLFYVFCLVTWLYLVPLKRSRFRTLGYRLTGSRLVTLQGNRPSLFAITMRLGFWGFGPSNLFFDMVWCGIDHEQQTLRDRFTGLCVVRNAAQPVGRAPIHLAYYTAMGYCVMLPRCGPAGTGVPAPATLATPHPP